MGIASSVQDFQALVPGALVKQTTLSGKTLSGKVNALQQCLRLTLKTQVDRFVEKSVQSIVTHGGARSCSMFMDSVFIKKFLSTRECQGLFDCLAVLGEKNRPSALADAAKVHNKYPLWTKYYGCRRNKDGARALDRWGSNHESWMRVEEPPTELQEICGKLRRHFGLQAEAANSIVVNYYYDGDSTYIPAHRDTTACLQEESSIYCLSLGASRDFVLCANEDAGKYVKEQMSVRQHYRVEDGDMFSLGQRTNERYCHAVPQEPGLSRMRISIIFRSVDKSFLGEAVPKDAQYADGHVRTFALRCITTQGMGDEGTSEHLADLIAEREDAKRKKLARRREQGLEGQVLRQVRERAGGAARETAAEVVGSVMLEAVSQSQSQAQCQSLSKFRAATPPIITPSLTPHPSAEDIGCGAQSEDPDFYYMGTASTVPVTATYIAV
ncbi:hypothetical protein B484DRAFT_403243 [Ochromonadaceae sp. CCMP2298]|nr:hypothetical protein B484DRAFT_403243 [Ochromonadaceae sp. CCMP2298]